MAHMLAKRVRMAALLAAALTLPPLAGLARAEPAAVLTVERHVIDDLKAVFATVESVDSTRARARIGGTIGALAVDEGDMVTRGQVLAVVEDPKLTLRLAALDARIRSLEAQLRQARVELERIEALHRSGTAAQARLDDAHTQLDVVTSELAAQRAERAVVAQQLAEGAVLAPASGRVLRVEVVEGSVVLPGEPVAVIATERYVLRLHLPERHARFLQVGDPVLVGARGLGRDAAERWAGTVRQIYPEIRDGRVVADVEVEGLGDFFVGERVQVYVSAGRRDALVVPESYVFRRHGVSYVRLAEGGAVVVQTGRAVPLGEGSGIEILSGLRPGDVLVMP